MSTITNVTITTLRVETHPSLGSRRRFDTATYLVFKVENHVHFEIKLIGKGLSFLPKLLPESIEGGMFAAAPAVHSELRPAPLLTGSGPVCCHQM